MATGTWRMSSRSEAAGASIPQRQALRIGVLRSGVALTLAFAGVYVVCSLLVAAFPTASTQVLNALFHGVDFGKLQLGAEAFSLSRLGVGATLWALKGLVFGVVFAVLYNALGWLATRWAPVSGAIGDKGE